MNIKKYIKPMYIKPNLTLQEFQLNNIRISQKSMRRPGISRQQTYNIWSTIMWIESFLSSFLAHYSLLCRIRNNNNIYEVPSSCELNNLHSPCQHILHFFSWHLTCTSLELLYFDPSLELLYSWLTSRFYFQLAFQLELMKHLAEKKLMALMMDAMMVGY